MSFTASLPKSASVLRVPAMIFEARRWPLVLVNLVHLDPREAFTVRRGDRIAQMVVAPVSRAVWDEVETLDDTARGAGGFGSTGRG